MVKYQIKNYENAESIINNLRELEEGKVHENYLRELVFYVTHDDAFTDNLDYRGLKREGYKIRGIARKMLKSKDKRDNKNKDSIDKMIEENSQLKLFD